MRRPPVDSPSIVVTLFPSTLETGVRHDTVGESSINTVQARHWPSPQPYFVPVRPKSSRTTSSSGRSGGDSVDRSSRLMRIVNRAIALF